MRLLYFLADAFIQTFGITQPTAAQRRRVAFFIFTLILVVIVAVGTVAVLLRGLLTT